MSNPVDAVWSVIAKKGHADEFPKSCFVGICKPGDGDKRYRRDGSEFVYFLVRKADGRVDYIGKTNCLGRRLSNHFYTKWYHDLVIASVQKESIYEIESYLIRIFEPPLNSKKYAYHNGTNNDVYTNLFEHGYVPMHLIPQAVSSC